MTIIAPGKAPEAARHECYECNCVFDFDANEATKIANVKEPLAKVSEAGKRCTYLLPARQGTRKW